MQYNICLVKNSIFSLHPPLLMSEKKNLIPTHAESVFPARDCFPDVRFASLTACCAENYRFPHSLGN